MDKVGFSPILVLSSPTSGCGKTTAVHLLEQMSRNGVLHSGTTASAYKRELNELKGEGTLIIDEADECMFHPRVKGQFTSILNAGFQKRGSTVTLSEGTASGKYKPTLLSVWGAKAIAGILIGRRLAPATKTRSFLIQLQKKPRFDERIKTDDIPLETYASINERLVRFSEESGIVFDNTNTVFDRKLKYRLDDRQKDIWRPFLQIAQAAGQEWMDKAKEAALYLSETEEDVDSDSGVMKNLLEDIREIIEREGYKYEIPCALLTAELTKDIHMRWGSYSGGKPLTSNQLGRMLSEFDIKSKAKKMDGRTTTKCYSVSELEKVFEVYIPRVEDEDDDPEKGETIRFH